MRIEQFVIDGLGHLSTLLADDDAGVAAVIDPRRDVDVYLAAARERDLRITHVVETHLHNDYVSGGRELAALTGASHRIGAGAELRHEHEPVRHGESFDVGDASVHGARHARAHAGARELRGGRPEPCRGAGPADDRWLAARRGGRPDGSPRRRARRAVRAPDVPLAPRRAASARGLRRRLPDARRRLPVLDGHCVHAAFDDRLRATAQRAARPDGRGRVRPRAAVRPADLPALLRPDAPHEPGRAAPPRGDDPGIAAARPRRGACGDRARCAGRGREGADRLDVGARPRVGLDPCRLVLRDVARLGRRPRSPHDPRPRARRGRRRPDAAGVPRWARDDRRARGGRLPHVGGGGSPDRIRPVA